ncbi:MAG: hypothetical protein VX913_07375 [Planctomycetota bacterium]|nr:hypothetical protein [Planctomycetota bacterium]
MGFSTGEAEDDILDPNRTGFRGGIANAEGLSIEALDRRRTVFDLFA